MHNFASGFDRTVARDTTPAVFRSVRALLEVAMVDAGLDAYCFGPFRLELRSARLLLGDEPISLRPRSFELLRYFAENPGRLISRDELMGELWPRVVVTDESLTHCVTDVRQALQDTSRRLVRTVPRRGYLFAAEVNAAIAVVDTPRAPGSVRRDPPRSSTPLVGRDDDQREVIALLVAHGVVSLVGPGGVGKSALARVVLQHHGSAHADGCAWVDLAALGADTGAGLALAVAGTAGVTIGSADPMLALVRALAPLQMLLVLDNAEHLANAVRALVRALAECAPRLRVLVTSQVPLGLTFEQVMRLAPLALPPYSADRDTVRRSAAVALFELRARAADSRFSLDRANLATAVELCRRLDGLPLAIELAAARVPWLGLPNLAASLDERFRSLAGTTVRSDSRHLTLVAAMDWSHGLLDELERTVFRRLAVFAGSFTLDAAQALLAGSSLDRWDVLQAVGGLVERSLLAATDDPSPRYRLLETPRAYALERLRQAAEEPTLRLHHARTMRVRLEHAYGAHERGAVTADDWRAGLQADLDDARAALMFARESDAPSAVALADCMALVLSSESPGERRTMLLDTLPLLDLADSADRVRWYLEAASAFADVRPVDARAWAAAALAGAREFGDHLGVYRALGIGIYIAQGEGESPLHPYLAEMQHLEDARFAQPAA